MTKKRNLIAVRADRLAAAALFCLLFAFAAYPQGKLQIPIYPDPPLWYNPSQKALDGKNCFYASGHGVGDTEQEALDAAEDNAFKEASSGTGSTIYGQSSDEEETAEDGKSRRTVKTVIEESKNQRITVDAKAIKRPTGDWEAYVTYRVRRNYNGAHDEQKDYEEYEKFKILEYRAIVNKYNRDMDELNSNVAAYKAKIKSSLAIAENTLDETEKSIKSHTASAVQDRVNDIAGILDSVRSWNNELVSVKEGDGSFEEQERALTLRLNRLKPMAPGGKFKKRVAIYTEDPDAPWRAKNIPKMLHSELREAITKRGGLKYELVERTEAVDKALSAGKGRGNISDELIKEMGERYQVDMMCIGTIKSADNLYILDVSLVDVETGNTEIGVHETSPLINPDKDGLAIARNAAKRLVNGGKGMDMKTLKTVMFVSAVSLDVLGAGIVGYGLYQDRDVAARIREGELGKNDAKNALRGRDVCYVIGGALLASGISIHIFFK